MAKSWLFGNVFGYTKLGGNEMYKHVTAYISSYLGIDCGSRSIYSFSALMQAFGSHVIPTPRRPVLSPIEFAQKMAHDMPLIFSGSTICGDPVAWYDDNWNILQNIRNKHSVSLPVLAQSIADTINSCIQAGIRTICADFAIQGSYDVLESRLRQLRWSTKSICGAMHLVFQPGGHDCGPGFHQELFRMPRMTILNEVVRSCKMQLIPVISRRIRMEFEQHHDIEATSFALQQLATRFDTVGILIGVYPESAPHTMGLAAAQVCARVLLPQMEQAYGAITEAIIMSLDPLSDHTSILHRVLADQDFRSITPLMGSRYEAMQFCHALANAHVVGVPPALLDNSPYFFKR